MHDREDRITGFATGSFLGCELIYVGFTDFYTLCIFTLKCFVTLTLNVCYLLCKQDLILIFSVCSGLFLMRPNTI